MIEQSGTAIILVEQHAELALSLTHDVLVMERGAIVHRARSVLCSMTPPRSISSSACG